MVQGEALPPLLTAGPSFVVALAEGVGRKL